MFFSLNYCRVRVIRELCVVVRLTPTALRASALSSAALERGRGKGFVCFFISTNTSHLYGKAVERVTERSDGRVSPLRQVNVVLSILCMWARISKLALQPLRLTPTALRASALSSAALERGRRHFFIFIFQTPNSKLSIPSLRQSRREGGQRSAAG
ncbi:hypothetical protein SAMN05216464_102185 [Mucilaginibacter pineti]|uniref:Uncharacterized protein n=1 Tax=Mucilaginibacter pineti TaxID=1391627 RepID=A0A1G6WHM7_9SPHI|nr:hypothetical protein SAMN05216464_102185 [Mucilaginibacter pineti]